MWANPIVSSDGSSYALEHHDGSVSVLVSWDGIKLETAPDDAVYSSRAALFYRTLAAIMMQKGVVVENHFSRRKDSSIADKYMEYGEKNIIREREAGLYFRREIAHHLGQYAEENTVSTVFILPSKLPGIAGIFPKSAKNKIEKNAEFLLGAVTEIIDDLPGGKIELASEYFDKIMSMTQPDYKRAGVKNSLDGRFYINQVTVKKPIINNGFLKVGDTYSKVCLLIDYPDCKTGWVEWLSYISGVETHITQIVTPLDQSIETMRSARETEKGLESAGGIGGESTAGKLKDHAVFRNYIQEHNLGVFSNTYIIRMDSTSQEFLEDTWKRVKRELVNSGAVFEDEDEAIQMLYWRIGIFGNGYKSPFKRPDHTWQVAHMAPVIGLDHGATDNPQQLRLSTTGGLVCEYLQPNGVHHCVAAAMTGSGKSVYKGTQILELFPLGYNFNIAEYGGCFKWVVEGFGGDYFTLNSRDTVISPLPLYSMRGVHSDGSLLSSDIIDPTMSAIMPVLCATSSWRKLPDKVHIQSAAEDLIQALYIEEFRDKTLSAPTLKTLLNVGRDIYTLLDTKEKRESAEKILSNLDSFLSTSSGKPFTYSETLNFDKPIIGVDFKPLLSSDSKDLALLMLTFIGIRFKQLAFSKPEPVINIFDEYHEFTAIDPILMSDMTRQQTRMGRKEAGYFHGISQEIMDIAVEKGVLNQIPHRELLFYKDGHDEIIKNFNIPPRAGEIWKGFINPNEVKLNYRNCIKVLGDKFWSYYLTNPEAVMLMTNSDPSVLAYKNEIGKKESDMMKRLLLLRERIGV